MKDGVGFYTAWSNVFKVEENVCSKCFLFGFRFSILLELNYCRSNKG